MMAALYLLSTVVIGLVMAGKRGLAIALFIVNLFLCIAMMWHHMDSVLQINW